MEFRLTASPRHRLEAYSLPMTLLLARIPPMPMPVKTRSSPSCVADALTDDRSIPTAAIAKQIRIIGRRPMRSAQGASSIDPSAIPTRPAESRSPSCAPLSPHSVDTGFSGEGHDEHVEAVEHVEQDADRDREPLEAGHRSLVHRVPQRVAHRAASHGVRAEQKSMSALHCPTTWWEAGPRRTRRPSARRLADRPRSLAIRCRRWCGKRYGPGKRTSAKRKPTRPIRPDGEPRSILRGPGRWPERW